MKSAKKKPRKGPNRSLHRNQIKAVGKRLGELRIGSGLSQKAMAEILDIDRDTQYRREAGLDFRLSELFGYAQAFGLPASELLKGINL